MSTSKHGMQRKETRRMATGTAGGRPRKELGRDRRGVSRRKGRAADLYESENWEAEVLKEPRRRIRPKMEPSAHVRADEGLRRHRKGGRGKRKPVGIALYTALAALLAVSAVGCVGTAYAAEGQQKHAVPSIAKAVSLDGNAFSESVTSNPDGSVTYRIVLTMPEGVEALKSVTYAVHDTPNENIVVDSKSIRATIVGSDGEEKAHPDTQVRLARGKLTIALGDLKAKCPNLAFADKVFVSYGAKVRSSAPAGQHPNVAKLVYDLGEGERETAEVMAKVIVGKAANGPEGSAGKTVAKTGDMLKGASIACTGFVLASGLALLYARKRRS